MLLDEETRGRQKRHAMTENEKAVNFVVVSMRTPTSTMIVIVLSTTSGNSSSSVVVKTCRA